MRAFALSCAVFMLACTACAQRGENLLRDAGFEEGRHAPAPAWQFFGKGYELVQEGREGGWCIRCSAVEPDEILGARQTIQFDPPLKHPFLIEGWSKCQGASESGDYSVYLDVYYADGTPLWGQRADFSPGSHDWQKATNVFDPEKPVASIRVFVLFRRLCGTAWFDDISVALVPFEFSDFRVEAGLYGGSGVELEADTTLPATWRAFLTQGEQTVGIQQGSGRVRGSWAGLLRGVAIVSVEATDTYQGETIRKTHPLVIRDTRPLCPALWTSPSMVRVHLDDFPASKGGRPTLELSLARNEFESAQILLRTPPGYKMQGVRLVLSDLRSESGATLPARNIEWHQVGFVRIEKQFPHPLVRNRAPCWWPDPLLPVTCFDVGERSTQPIWITAYAPPDQPPGLYSGTIRVADEAGWSREVPIRVTIWDFCLPVTPRLKTAFALMDGFLEKIYGKPLTPELRQAYGDYVLRHRLNPDDISRTDPPAIEDLLHYRGRGLNAFNILNMVAHRGDAPWRCWSPLDVYTQTFKRQLIGRLDPYIAKLRTHHLTDIAYVYTFDERKQEFFPVIKEYFGMIKERYPEIHTLTTAKVPQDPQIMADLNVDWLCPPLRAYRFQQAESVRAAGREVWSYVCCGPRYPYANWLADDPLIDVRAIWWQVFHQKMDGFLYWGLNIWSRPHNDAVINPADGPFLNWSITTARTGTWSSLHGDGILLYPGSKTPIGSIRLANIRDGLEDYDYLHLLAQTLGHLAPARDACHPLTTDLRSLTRDPSLLLTQRAALARQLQQH